MRWASSYHLRHVQSTPLFAAMDMRLVYIPLQNNPSKYEDLLSTISGIPRNHILRWYIAKVENDQALVEVVHTATGESDANPTRLHQKQMEKKRISSKTPFPNSNYNSVLDVYAEYGRQPKPTVGKVKSSVEEFVDDNVSTGAINEGGSQIISTEEDAMKDDVLQPVDIDIDPFAYIL